MCSITIGAMVAGTLIQARSSAMRGEALQEQANYNSKVAEIKAQETISNLDSKLEAHRQKASAFKARQEVGFASMGVDLSSGSAQKILNETEMIAEVDAMNIQREAEQQANAYLSQSQMIQHEGQVGQMTAQLDTIGTIIGGGAQAYGEYRSSRKS